MVLGNLFGDFSIWRTLLSFGFLLLMFMFLPRLLLMQIVYKLRNSLQILEGNANKAEEIFLNTVSHPEDKEVKEKLEPMKNMVMQTPTSLDPYGIVKKLENILDSSESKMKGFVEDIAGEREEEEKANLVMAFKGVYGAHQLFLVMRHFQKLIEETQNYQLGGALQMVLPVYEELSESQMKATEAFVKGVPIGDSVGPYITAMFMENEAEEVAEDIVVSKEEFDGKNLHVVKSKGEGARLGKYGDAVDKVASENDIDLIITVDAGMRFEGEETGKISEGIGVLMGGPGVEKSKIEDVATEKDIPLEGFVIKQSGPQASKPMHKKIYNAADKAKEKIQSYIQNSDKENIMLIGVGNTCGIGNSKESVERIDEKLKEYWEEEEEEATSYFGLMKAFPFGGQAGRSLNANINSELSDYNSFELFRSWLR